jgi:hypothetical protein
MMPTNAVQQQRASKTYAGGANMSMCICTLCTAHTLKEDNLHQTALLHVSEQSISKHTGKDLRVTRTLEKVNSSAGDTATPLGIASCDESPTLQHTQVGPPAIECGQEVVGHVGDDLHGFRSAACSDKIRNCILNRQSLQSQSHSALKLVATISWLSDAKAAAATGELISLSASPNKACKARPDNSANLERGGGEGTTNLTL